MAKQPNVKPAHYRKAEPPPAPPRKAEPHTCETAFLSYALLQAGSALRSLRDVAMTLRTARMGAAMDVSLAEDLQHELADAYEHACNALNDLETGGD